MEPPLHQFNFFDVFLLTVIGFSMIVGFARGFIREALGLMAWATAFFLAFQNFAWPYTLLRPWIADETMLQIASQLVVFCGSLVILLFIVQWISYTIQNSLAQSVDRSLGIVFGILRGCLLICGGYLISLSLIPREKQPLIVSMSRSVPLLDKGALMLQNSLPVALRSKEIFKNNLEEIAKKQISAQELIKKLSHPRPQ